MDQEPKLFPNQQFDLHIQTVYDQPEPFQAGANKDKTKYAHKFLLVDDSLNGFPVQIISDSATQKYGREGDIIRILVKTHTRNIYTVEYIKTLFVAERESFDVVTKVNPPVGGTAAAVAMSLSIQYFAYKTEEPESGHDIFTKAEQIRKWLIKNS